jgi:hypothetical protein
LRQPAPARGRRAPEIWRLKRGVFRSIIELQAAINRYLAEHNQAPRPFIWIRSADAILDRLAPTPASFV